MFYLLKTIKIRMEGELTSESEQDEDDAIFENVTMKTDTSSLHLPVLQSPKA